MMVVGATEGDNEGSSIPLDSVIAVQSTLFTKARVKFERSQQCPNNTKDWNFTVQKAQVQVTSQIIVTLDIYFVALGQTYRGVRVLWTPTARSDSALDGSALGNLEDDLARGRRFADALDGGVKLMLRGWTACQFGDRLPVDRNTTVLLEGLSEEEQLEAEAAADGTDVAFEMTFQPVRPLGVIIEKELEGYRRGLAQQAALQERFSPYRKRAKLGPMPASWNWRKQSPDCLDYIHDQGSCGACYMFAAIDTLSDRHCINKQGTSTLGKINHLSVQRPLLCEPLGRQCSGGWADVAYNYSLYYFDDIQASWGYEPSCLSQSPCAFGNTCMTASSNKCAEFFTPAEITTLDNQADALRIVKGKCSTLLLADSCTSWAISFFSSPTKEYLPSNRECKWLQRNFSLFQNTTRASLLQQEDASLLQETDEDEDDEDFELDGRGKRFWPFDGWGRRRRSDDDNQDQGGDDTQPTDQDAPSTTTGKPRTTTTTTTAGKTAFGLTIGQKVTWTGADSDVPAGSIGTIVAFTADKVQVTFPAGSWLFAPGDLKPALNKDQTARLCDRSRCSSEQPLAVHTLTKYDYISNTKDAFKQQLYNEGPFYTSIYIYEDFSWFFHLFPTDAYSRQWGAQLGGHAVSLIGWEAGCTYYINASGGTTPAPSLVEEAAGPATPIGSTVELEAQRSLLGPRRLRATAPTDRQTGTSECWQLRNTWGASWGDQGYFRLKDDMLTGPDGTNIHIASAAAHGPVSADAQPKAAGLLSTDEDETEPGDEAFWVQPAQDEEDASDAVPADPDGEGERTQAPGS